MFVTGISILFVCTFLLPPFPPPPRRIFPSPSMAPKLVLGLYWEKMITIPLFSTSHIVLGLLWVRESHECYVVLFNLVSSFLIPYLGTGDRTGGGRAL